MSDNPLLRLSALGQSVWLDDLNRRLIASGELRRWIDADGISGVTTNPAIFEKAIGASADYDAAIAALSAQGKSAPAIYQAITLADVSAAADLLLPVYAASETRSGFVSVEVSPELASLTRETVAEARALWRELGRPNVFIKIPATQAGVAAMPELIAAGINVNATLLFSVARYREIADAYLGGLERRLASGAALTGVASVASFFVSRIDTRVDAELFKLRAANEECAGLLGQAAIASAKLAYQAHLVIYAEQRYQRLQRRGARPQRLLWASTGTKNAAYSPVKYIEALIAADTITTIPQETLDAYRAVGQPALRLGQSLPDAQRVISDLARLGIDMHTLTRELETEGVEKFTAAYAKGLAAIERKRG